MIFPLVFWVGITSASLDLSYGDDGDLTHFVTRPEIRVPRYNVTVRDARQVTPGYWFTAPYANIQQQPHPPLYYQSCQTGPAIYDDSGELVWSGACQVRNQNTCDFRAWRLNDTLYTSAILYGSRYHNDAKGHGVLMDSSYRVVKNVTIPKVLTIMNMHDLILSEEGRKALYITWMERRADLSELSMDGVKSGWIGDIGFNEVDLVSGDIAREWWAAGSGEISISESRAPIANLAGPWPQAWDFLHGNSIDRNEEGDFLFSARYTDTIYKISGESGKIIWRLGGQKSSFTQDFTFSGQHDARTLSINKDEEIISFLDNASDEYSQTANHSSALVIRIDRREKTARVLTRIVRPDNKLTRMRGNHQILDNGNHFVCWSESSYISEHAANGSLLMEARFASPRFATYRAYKFNYTGIPEEPPAVVAEAVGPTSTRSVTTVHVSWNGATEVHTWRFHKVEPQQERTLLGEKGRIGFETAFYYDGHAAKILVEAVDKDGEVIGTSPVTLTKAPSQWSDPDDDGSLVTASLALTQQASVPDGEVDGPTPGTNRVSLLMPTVSNFLTAVVQVLICLTVGYCCLCFCRPYLDRCRGRRRWRKTLQVDDDEAMLKEQMISDDG